jgi:two-component system nitrogen regulation sensor histidine kinase NtrY
MQAGQKMKKRRIPWVLGLVVLGLLMVLILLQASNLWKGISIETASDTLLLYGLSSLNFIALVIFGFIFLRSVVKLARERRALQLGSKIKTRLLMYFALISLLPIIAMAVFSYLFLNRALERWFTQIPETVVRQAGEIQVQSVKDQSAKLAETARMMAVLLEERELSDKDLQSIAEAGNLTRIEIVASDGRILNAGGKTIDAGSEPELQGILAVARSETSDKQILQDGKGYDAAVAKLPDGRKLIVVPDLRADETVSQRVESALAEFDRLKNEQANVRTIGFLTLGVLTFLLIFASTWTAFYIARGLTTPIRALAEGSDEIARGNLTHRVDVLAEDELALLVDSFNTMTAKLEQSAAALSEGRRYIETVLESLPTGVISFDGENRVTTINRAAKNILRLENGDFGEIGLSTLVRDENRIIIERLLARAKRIGHASEQTTLRRENLAGLADSDANIPAALITTALPGEGGCVLVIEDLSELIAAQRASAWQEVARRMAHEIKNPLTPIQLSAERIAKRARMEPAMASIGSVAAVDQSDVVMEGTDTILREVASLKAMVDEFSQFARLPDVRLEQGSVNDPIRQALAIYEDRYPDVNIVAQLEEDIPSSMIDAEQLKRVFVNLIDNSIEAFDVDAANKIISIANRFDRARELIVVELSDNGKGIDVADFPRLFQPYFSTKGRGTGLGLAIVHRIVADHRGKIRAANNSPGAKFVIELPTNA